MIRWTVNNDQPFNVTENQEFEDMLTFIRPGIQIPSADTLRRDLDDNFNIAKNIVRQELQVNNTIYIIILNKYFINPNK